MSGNNGVTIDVPRRAKRENRRQRRRRKFGKGGEDVRRFWRGICQCESCKGKSWPHIYVSQMTRTTNRRYGMRPRILAIGFMSYECAIERNHLAVDPDLAEELEKLRNEPERVGSVWRRRE